MICSIILTAGQFLFYFGSCLNQYWVVILGRAVFGIGGESLLISMSCIANRWFGNKELGFALAVTVSAGRLGSVANSLIEPAVAEVSNYQTSLLIGVLICAISVVTASMVMCLEAKAVMEDKLRGTEIVVENASNCGEGFDQLNTSYWLLTFNCLCIYTCVFQFNNISNDYFMTKYGFNQTEAARITSVVFFIPILLAPLCGAICDRIGQRVLIVGVAAVCLFMCHITFTAMDGCNRCFKGLWPLILVGVAYSIYASALWPMIPRVVPASSLGLAYGLTTAIQNFGLGFGPNIVALVKERTGGYMWVPILLSLLALLGLMSTVILYIVDYKSKGLLQKPHI